MLTGLHQLAGTGKPFVKVPELVKAVRDVAVPPTPPWTEAWAVIRRAMRLACRRRPKERGVEDAMLWLEAEHHPVIAGFVAGEGLERLTLVEFDDPDYGPLRIRELEQRWNRYVDVAESRLERGLALEASRGRQIGPARFDPASVIEGLRGRSQLPAGDG